MREVRTCYEILGVPRTATTAQIKKRYRELARRYHPDVSGGTDAKTFVQITEAYKTLVDPEKRRAYDATLIDTTQPVRPQPGPARSTEAPRRAQAAKLVKDAELAFIRRRLVQASELCTQAIAIDRNCARAHSILGDIYRARKKYDHAINEYNYAVQLDPSDRDSQAKLERLIERSRPLIFSWETPEGRMSNEAIILNIIGWGMAFFLLFLIYIYPGRSPSGIAVLVPILSAWSWNLAGLVFADGLLAGFLLAINGIVEHPDEELVFESGGRGLSVIPTGLLLVIFCPLFFPGAALLYLLFAFVQDTVSKSVVRILVAVAAIALIAAVMYPEDRLSVILFGGNVAFLGVLGGWYLGAMMRST